MRPDTIAACRTRRPDTTISSQADRRRAAATAVSEADRDQSASLDLRRARAVALKDTRRGPAVTEETTTEATTTEVTTTEATTTEAMIIEATQWTKVFMAFESFKWLRIGSALLF